MKIPLVGASYVERSLPFDAQRSINLFPVADRDGSEVSALYGTPGLSLFATAGVGATRGAISCSNGRAFIVSDSGFYEILANGTTVNRGSLTTSAGNCTLAENGNQVAICDGDKLFIFTYDTNNFQQVTDPDLPSSVGTVTFVNGYFIVNENNTGRFYLSALFNGLSWDALDFATAESNPDDLKRVAEAAGLLWLIGDKTTEIWQNTGASDFPFQRISGAVIDKGTSSPYSVIELENTLYWLMSDEQGNGTVYRASGFSPEKISTPAIDTAIQKATNLEDIIGWSYQQDGRIFYAITGGGLETTLVYDTTTGLWHERAFKNTSGDFEPHLAQSMIFAFGRHLCGSRKDGKIYEMSFDYKDDNGVEIISERTYTHLLDERKRLRYDRLEIFLESGVGTQTGQGLNPQISLQLSKDGARTWSNSYNAEIGKAGEYRTKVVFRRLGIAEIMTFRVRITDPVKRTLIGSYIA